MASMCIAGSINTENLLMRTSGTFCVYFLTTCAVMSSCRIKKKWENFVENLTKITLVEYWFQLGE